MRIPPYYKRPGWQRFLAGLLLGTLIGWGIFLYQYGAGQEEIIVDLRKNELTIEQLENQIELLREREEENDQLEAEALKIEEISIQFQNEKESRLSELALHDLQQQVNEELEHLLDQDIESVAENRELLIRTLENKRFSVDEHEYTLNVEEIYLYRVLVIHVQIEPSTPDS